MKQHNRNHKNARRKRKPRLRAKTRQLAPQTADQFFAMAKRSQDRWTHATNVVTKMRTNKASLRKASREFGISPQTVRRLVGAAIRKQRNGRYIARPKDRLLRVLVIPTSGGLREIALRDSRQATLLADYWTAVHIYLQTGDASALQKFQGKRIVDANGKRVRLLTDVAALDRLGNAGVLSFETIYAKR